MKQLKFYYILFNPGASGLNCGHEHKSAYTAEKCLTHYKKYYPNSAIFGRWEVIEIEDKPYENA